MTITLDGTRGITSPGDYQNSTFTGTYTDGVVVDYTSGQGRISTGPSDVLSFFNGGVATTELMRLDASGNLGIGTNSPSSYQGGGKLAINQAVSGTSIVWSDLSNDTGFLDIVSGAARIKANNQLVFNTNGAERMRIDSSGNLLVGTTSSSYAPITGVQLLNLSGGNYGVVSIGHASSVGTGAYYETFGYSGSVIGSITQNGTTAVAYNTTSDYRLKENVVPVTTGLATIEALNPVNFDWISDKRSDTGFLAHEFQAVIPNSVVGTKDAVDTDGKPVYQQMDNSGVVPYLVAAIKELKAITDTQAATITALEAKLKAANITGF
jgi:hypothetical protein